MFLYMYFETITDKNYIFNHIILIHKPVNVLILIFLFLFLTWYSTPIDINVDKRTL